MTRRLLKNEFMTSLGDDGCGLPGYDYPRIQAGWLCAIQQCYAELRKGYDVKKSCSTS